MRVLLLCLLTLVANAARADDTELKQKIVGTWKLVSVVYEDQESKARTPVYGEHPRGRQIASADERAQALRTMIAYTGRYRVEDGKVVTKVEAAWNEGWVGGEQTRFIRFEGDRLFIESPPMPHPNQNNRVVRVIVIWDREK